MKKQSVLRILAAVCSASMLLLCSACGKDTADPSGSGSAETEISVQSQKLTGTYDAVVAECMHVQMNAAQFCDEPMALRLKRDGSASLLVGAEETVGTWEQKDSDITFSFEEKGKNYTFTGTAEEDRICCDDLMNSGVKVTFGKAGTDAADISNYLTENEVAVVGHWMAKAVDLRDGYGSQPKMEDIDNINDAFQVRFSPDYTCSVVYMGEEVGDFHWRTVGDVISLDTDTPGLLAESNGDGTISVSYCKDGTFEDYKIFTCVPYSSDSSEKDKD